MIATWMKEIVDRRDLDVSSAETMMEEMLDGRIPTEQIAALLTALTMKGESVTEITACAQVMRRRTEARDFGDVMDIVGTGGDGAGTFNISTTAAFLAASVGVKIVKHGNRAASGRSGSADLLDRLGVRLDRTPEESAELFRRTGICFLYAPVCHRMSESIARTRRSLGFRTLFNILGPLTNPARPKREIMGVYDRRLIRPMSEVLVHLGVERGIVLCGSDGLDEATLTGPTYCRAIHSGTFDDFIIRPEDAGLSPSPLEAIKGGGPEENASIFRRILSGEERGPKRDVALLNAGLAVYLADRAASIRGGVESAAEAIDSGEAAQTFHHFLEAAR